MSMQKGITATFWYCKDRDMDDREACDECKLKCSLIHGNKTDPLPLVTTFTKILFGPYDVSRDLVFV